jgi:hypothetical protein
MTTGTFPWLVDCVQAMPFHFATGNDAAEFPARSDVRSLSSVARRSPDPQLAQAARSRPNDPIDLGRVAALIAIVLGLGLSMTRLGKTVRAAHADVLDRQPQPACPLD